MFLFSIVLIPKHDNTNRESSVKAWCLTNILLRWIFQSALYWCDAKPDGGQGVGHWYQEQQRCQWQQGGTGRWPRAATLACQGYHWQDQERCVKNINLLFLGCWMKALRQRKWDLGESSLGSLIASFENCSKASKKSPAHAYFVTNEIPPLPPLSKK